MKLSLTSVEIPETEEEREVLEITGLRNPNQKPLVLGMGPGDRALFTMNIPVTVLLAVMPVLVSKAVHEDTLNICSYAVSEALIYKDHLVAKSKPSPSKTVTQH